MSVMRLLLNIGLVIDLFKTIRRTVLGAVASSNKLPSCEDSKDLLSKVRILLEKKVIDVPGIEEDQIAKALREIEDRLVCSIEVSHRNLNKFGEIRGRVEISPESDKA